MLQDGIQLITGSTTEQSGKDLHLGAVNEVINGNFDIWQRAKSQTTSGYGSVDRWKNTNVGSTKTTSQQLFALGQTDVPNNPIFYMRTVVSSVAGSGNLVAAATALEDVTKLSGKTITLSFWAKADSSKNVAVEILQHFGTGGGESTSIIANTTTHALTTSWQQFQQTVTLPSVSGKGIGATGNDALKIRFWFDAGSTFNTNTNSLGQQSGTFDVSQVQLEESSSASEFQTKIFGKELLDCHRYFCKSYATTVDPATSISFGALVIEEIDVNKKLNLGFATFSQPMRSIPAVTIYDTVSGASGVVLDVLSFPTTRAISSINGISEKGFGSITLVVAATVSGGRASTSFHFAADAEI